MNIIKATRQAMEQGKGITSAELLKLDGGYYLLPTNTEVCYMIMPMGFEIFDKKAPAPRWGPTAQDVLREDWEIYENLSQ